MFMGRAREQWLETGLDVLVSDGSPGLTIDHLCTRLSKTKGSFYHHFAGREDFCNALLEHWEQKHTDDLIKATNEKEPGLALSELDRFARALPFDRESAFRRWAQASPQAAEVVRRVDTRRVAYVEELLISKGTPGDLAHTLAWLEYSLLLGASSLRDVLPEEERRKMHRLVRQLEEDNS